MWPNPFERLRRKRAAASGVPIPTPSASASPLPSTAQPPHTLSHSPAGFGAYTTISQYTRYTASPGASSSTDGISTSTSSASPVYTFSSRQASPFYGASTSTASPYYGSSSRHPSPLAMDSTGATTYTLNSYRTERTEGLSMSAWADGEGYFRPPTEIAMQGATATPPQVSECGIAASRNSEIWMARERDERLGRPVIVPRGLVQGMVRARRWWDEEEEGATRYMVPEDHLVSMRRVLAGAPIDKSTSPIPTTMITSSDPETGPRTSSHLIPDVLREPTLAPIDENKELEDEDPSTRSATDGHPQKPPTQSTQTTPELSSSCGSPISLHSTPTIVPETPFKREPVSASVDEMNEMDEPSGMRMRLSLIEWWDDSDGWADETVSLLQKISMSEHLSMETSS